LCRGEPVLALVRRTTVDQIGLGVLVAWDTGYMLLRCALSTPRLPRSYRPRLLTRDADHQSCAQMMRGRGAHIVPRRTRPCSRTPHDCRPVNVVFLVLAARHSPVAVLIGAIATAMTASKTVLYWQLLARLLRRGIPTQGSARHGPVRQLRK
jgi:hypothetical protein